MYFNYFNYLVKFLSLIVWIRFECSCCWAGKVKFIVRGKKPVLVCATAEALDASCVLCSMLKRADIFIYELLHTMAIAKGTYKLTLGVLAVPRPALRHAWAGNDCQNLLHAEVYWAFLGIYMSI